AEDEAAAQPQAPPSGMRGGGIADDLARAAADLGLEPQQQSAFDAALQAVRQRQAARRAPQQGGGSSLFGGGFGGPRIVMGGSGDMAAQIRQRMAQRFRQDFAAFRATLDEDQRKAWDAALSSLLNAR